MFGRILVPYDGSAPCVKALVHATQLAREQQAWVRLVHVIDGLEAVSGLHYSHEALDEARRHGERVLADGAAICRAAGIPHDSQLLDRQGRRLGEAVADEASAWKAQLVVIGSHGRRGLQRLQLGSGAEQVLRLSPVPVLLVRDPGLQPSAS